MSQPADWKHLISMQGRYWGRLSLCDSSQSTPLIIMAQGRESAREKEKSGRKKITAFSNKKNIYGYEVSGIINQDNVSASVLVASHSLSKFKSKSLLKMVTREEAKPQILITC